MDSLAFSAYSSIILFRFRTRCDESDMAENWFGDLGFANEYERENW